MLYQNECQLETHQSHLKELPVQYTTTTMADDNEYNLLKASNV